MMSTIKARKATIPSNEMWLKPLREEADNGFGGLKKLEYLQKKYDF